MNITAMIINICEDFSAYPGGRYRKHGKFSGEVLRDDLLYPELMIREVIADAETSKTARELCREGSKGAIIFGRV